MGQKKGQEIKIELTPEVAAGHYSNFAVITHGPSEFYMDFIALAPNMPQAKVQSRIIMTPENAKNLMNALMENVKRYEATFGEIKPKAPRNNPAANNGNNPNDIPNPFMFGGNA